MSWNNNFFWKFWLFVFCLFQIGLWYMSYREKLQRLFYTCEHWLIDIYLKDFSKTAFFRFVWFQLEMRIECRDRTVTTELHGECSKMVGLCESSLSACCGWLVGWTTWKVVCWCESSLSACFLFVFCVTLIWILLLLSDRTGDREHDLSAIKIMMSDVILSPALGKWNKLNRLDKGGDRRGLTEARVPSFNGEKSEKID